MKTKKIATVVALIMAFSFIVLSLTFSATAILDKNGSITLTVKDPETGVPIENISFKLYFVANAYEKADGVRYELVAPYDKANIDISDLQDSYLPVHLAYFADSHSLDFVEKNTDENGTLVFDNLAPGLYLIVPVENENGYASSPFVIAVPEYDAENKSWVYNVVASPKVNGEIDDGDSDTYISVVKKWKSNKKHPESITAVLLCNFKEYDRVELSESNNWHYRWDSLPKDCVWSVVEEQVPDGYTVYYDTSVNTVTIINRSDEKEPPSDPEGETTTRPSDDGGGDLIHTGQLNWPIPVLAIAGLLCFSIGWAILNLGKKETE